MTAGTIAALAALSVCAAMLGAACGGAALSWLALQRIRARDVRAAALRYDDLAAELRAISTAVQRIADESAVRGITPEVYDLAVRRHRLEANISTERAALKIQ